MINEVSNRETSPYEVYVCRWRRALILSELVITSLNDQVMRVRLIDIKKSY